MEEEPKKHLSPWLAWSIVAFIIIVVGGGIWYFNKQIADIYNNNISVTVKKKTPATTAKTTTTTSTTTTTADWKTYTNSTYGFTMTFTDVWEGYKAVERLNTTDPLVYGDIYIALPTKSDWSETDLAKLDNYATPLIISVYTLENWDKAQLEEGPKPTEIGRNDKYVFAYSRWQACPTDLCDKNLDFSALIQTFKLN